MRRRRTPSRDRRIFASTERWTVGPWEFELSGPPRKYGDEPLRPAGAGGTGAPTWRRQPRVS
jgi:hypothetical protein